MSEDMVKDGFEDIMSIDISSVAIEMMRKNYEHVPQMKYIQMDVRDMGFFPMTQLETVVFHPKTNVSISFEIMNLVGCWFSAMPVCHGAGGLARQYRFGGRSGLSVVFLGAGKLILGLLFGNSFVRVLSEFPIGILGVLLLFAGIELAIAIYLEYFFLALEQN